VEALFLFLFLSFFANMLGLRAESEQKHLYSLTNQNQHKRSYKFAESLNGRFFVMGVSGGFEKYSRGQLPQKKNNEQQPQQIEQPKPKYDHQPVLERYQREELRKEAQRLMELEEKLFEVIIFTFLS